MDGPPPIPEWFGTPPPPGAGPSRLAAVVILGGVIGGGVWYARIQRDRAHAALATASAAASAEQARQALGEAALAASVSRLERNVAELEASAAQASAAQASAPPPAPPAPVPPEASSAPSASDIAAASAAMRTQARKCFEQALKADPEAEGRVIVTVEARADGRVTKAHATRTGTLPAEMQQCIEKAFLGLQLPRTNGATRVSVPFVFKTE